MRHRDSSSNDLYHVRDVEPHRKVLQKTHCPTAYDVVRNCIHELLNVFCGAEEEKQTMKEWMLSVRDTMHVVVAEAEIQGLDGVALVEKFSAAIDGHHGPKCVQGWFLF